MGPPTDPGPLGSAQVSKWSVRPWWGKKLQDPFLVTTRIRSHGCSRPCDLILHIALRFAN
ncbi:unnamed protein product [Staurois parvus]|uniref:Uncharacterized protein n=1 Tax=Staurois parvus TaxID=386267 RepID=A0ABN9CQV0_9NEOB|nr:unnamed protein product [Staurois parvus]